MTPSPDTSNVSPNPLQAPVDPVIAALLAVGAPTQIAPAPTQAADALAPPGTTPSMLNPPGGAVPQQQQIGVGPVPQDPYAQPATGGQPVNPYEQVPVTPPNDLGGTPQGPLKSGDVVGATNAQNQAVTTQTGNIASTELAKTDALAAHANAKADVYAGHATAQGLVDMQYQKAREAAHQDSMAEAAAWQRDLDKKVAEEPVPGRWFERQSGFSKVMYIASLAFGALAQSHNANLKNVGLEMITQEINADIQAQRDKLKQQVDALNKKGDRIDRRLAERIAESKDDHAMLGSRLAIVQQAALERSNAPGPLDQKAAMAEAAQWAGAQRLAITGARADRAYAEREGKLGRDAENARAYLTDQRERDLKAAELRKDYDLARINLKAQDTTGVNARVKDSVVLSPATTGVRVVDDDTGAPIATPLSQNGGLTVSKANEKAARQTADIASDKYAAMVRVSKALGQNENLNVLLKRNPQLISDIVKLGYQGARNELDPNGRVTDKDFVAGLEHELGGDLETLSGRVASSTFSAGQGKLKELVDAHIRNYPKFVSHRLGSLIDASIPGYEGNVRVDWTPKNVETDEPAAPSTRQIDATYGIKTPLKEPQNLEELKQAQDLQKNGVEALPPYKPGSQDKVTKALEDFKNASPDTIDKRGTIVSDQLYKTGDQRAVLEVMQAKDAEIKKAKKRVVELGEALKEGEGGILDMAHKTVGLDAASKLAKKYGLGQMTGEEIVDLIKKVGLTPKTE